MSWEKTDDLFGSSHKNNSEVMGNLEVELFPSGVENNMELRMPESLITKPKKKAKLSSSSHDPVNHPKHYTEHPSGIECIQVTEHMSFCLGNAVKYIWRADLKQNAIEDLQKAVWYINREIEKRSK